MPEPIPKKNIPIKRLKELWHTELKSNPPPIASQVFLNRAYQHELQLTKHGDLLSRDLKRLNGYLPKQDSRATNSKVNTKQPIILSPGSRLLRNWNGKTYTVSVIEEGFVYQDKVWPSLSAIARDITGAHWSGPRFFSTKTERIAA